ncbi:TfuA-like protein [Sphaerisporangium sp. NPDC005288]|uniref:TfuA-like protein n=1 Tax=Sphaerisporangium sp. NPDC005288 TaxID=3155114 RepID=UPI0033A3072C
MSAKVVVYAGPTISPDEIRDVVPGARVRPPVARGDLLAEDWARGDTAVIIDGYYRERLSVGHKEILWLLGEGVEVIGAASMGALRAAELGPYGMRGVGTVHRMYATGEVDGDDEVAVLHGPASLGYPAGTVAMVNIRYGCREGARTDLVPAAIGERIVRAAKERPFAHRTWREMGEALGPDAGDALAALERMIGSGEWDLKRRDALYALRAAATPPASIPPGSIPSASVSAMPASAQAMTGPPASGGPVFAPVRPASTPSASGAPGAARPEPEAPGAAGDRRPEPAVSGSTGSRVAEAVLTGITHNEVLRRRSRREYAPGRWMSDLDLLTAGRLFDPGYPALHEEVLSGLLRDFAGESGAALEAYTRARLGVAEGEDLPPSLAAWLTDAEPAALPVAELLRLVMVRVWPVWQSADWRPAVLSHVRDTGRLREWADTVARADEATERSRGRLVVPPPEISGRIFLRHWRRDGSSAQVELARRGYNSAEELGRATRRFFALDVQSGRRATGA